VKGLSTQAKNALFRYDWPGNIRELRNCIEASVVLCKSDMIELSDLPPQISGSDASAKVDLDVGITIAEGEKRLIMSTISACKGNKTKAAQILGIGRKTLHRKLQEYQLEYRAD